MSSIFLRKQIRIRRPLWLIFFSFNLIHFYFDDKKDTYVVCLPLAFPTKIVNCAVQCRGENRELNTRFKCK